MIGACNAHGTGSLIGKFFEEIDAPVRNVYCIATARLAICTLRGHYGDFLDGQGLHDPTL